MVKISVDRVPAIRARAQGVACVDLTGVGARDLLAAMVGLPSENEVQEAAKHLAEQPATTPIPWRENAPRALGGVILRVG